MDKQSKGEMVYLNFDGALVSPADAAILANIVRGIQGVLAISHMQKDAQYIRGWLTARLEIALQELKTVKPDDYFALGRGDGLTIGPSGELFERETGV